MGIACATGAFVLWGLFPIYWKQLAAVPAPQVVAHRTAWGLLCLALWVTLRRRWAGIRLMAGAPRAVFPLVASATLLGFNWLLYVWAVTHGHIVDASLGYYLNPLVNVVLGVVVLRERLSRGQAIAVALAVVGVTILALGHGRVPWIAFGLAFSFGFYGLIRKTISADALSGLLWEMALLAPIAIGFLVVAEAKDVGAFGHAAATTSTLLALGGAITVIPLLLFAVGARALPLSTLGFIQYLAPSLQFLIGVLLYGEPFTVTHAVSFAFIWSALGLLTVDLRRRLESVEGRSEVT